jgi:hypothetical protein
MHFFRRLRRFLAFVCLGAAGMLVLDGDPSNAPASSPAYSTEQSFIGEESDGVSATAPTTAPSPAPAPESARAPAGQTVARAPALWTGVPSTPIGAGIAIPFPGQAPSVIFELKRPDPPTARRLAPTRERLVAELTETLFPSPPRLDAMRLSHNSLELPARGRPPSR